MKKYKGPIIVLCCCIFVILVSGTFLISHAYFYLASTKQVLFNGTIYGNYADLVITKVYSNGTAVAGMNAVPAGYSLDQEATGCDKGSTFYSNVSNETVIKTLNKGDRCELYYVPHLVYWDVTVSGHSNLAPGSYPSGAYTTSNSAQYGTYVASNSVKHYLCGHDSQAGLVDICVSQPYTKYGLTGHTAGSNFTAAQQASAKAAFEKMYARHGLTVNCTTASDRIQCNIGRFPLRLYNDGSFDIQTANFYCEITSAGRATCS